MKLFLISIIILWPLAASSQLTVARIFSDNMVLQRDQVIPIWGKGVPGKKVAVSFSNEKKRTVVKTDSSWRIYFKKQKANSIPRSIQVSSDNENIEIKNILIGDIWLCSGQSNMEWPMSQEMHWNEEKEQASQPMIRFINPSPAGRYVYGVPYTDSLKRRLNKDGFYQWDGWKKCDSNTVRSMSAVGYYFAKNIIANENIPIGLINVSIGGASIETFISREALQNDQRFAAKVKGDWLENDNLPEWVRERGKQNVGNDPNGFRDEFGLNHAYKPGFAYEGGVSFLSPMPIKGVIWYQGESNALEPARVEEYKDLLHLMIDDYRKKWKQPGLPFYWVQLSSIDTLHYKSQYWPQFRDEQRKLLYEVQNSGMAVCSDIGFKNDVHPTNKKTVGERLARWALNKEYKRDIVPSGPLPAEARFKNGEVIITFQYASEKLRTADEKPLRGFSIDGQAEIKAMIRDGKVIIATQSKPAFVYYAWRPYSDANLVNREMLPASTFKLKVQ